MRAVITLFNQISYSRMTHKCCKLFSMLTTNSEIFGLLQQHFLLFPSLGLMYFIRCFVINKHTKSVFDMLHDSLKHYPEKSEREMFNIQQRISFLF